MGDDETNNEPSPAASNDNPVGDNKSMPGDHAGAGSRDFLQARKAMLVACAIFVLAVLFSLAYFGYQLYRFLATAGALVPTTVPWPNVLGHLFRAIGLALICWRLISVARCVDAKTGELSDEFAWRHRIFWKTGAWVMTLLAVFAVFEFDSSRRDVDGFFRPEYESGYATIKPDRIEFRRGSDEPVNGWAKRQLHDSEKEVFVSPVPEITGRDIERAVVRIAEIFPGTQTVTLYIQFTDEGAKKMENFTSRHLTLPIAVLINGELRAAPRVFSPLKGNTQLNNLFTLEEAAHMIRKGLDH